MSDQRQRELTRKLDRFLKAPNLVDDSTALAIIMDSWQDQVRGSIVLPSQVESLLVIPESCKVKEEPSLHIEFDTDVRVDYLDVMLRHALEQQLERSLEGDVSCDDDDESLEPGEEYT